MPDRMTKKQRSFVMSKIRNRNTSPEIKIRKLLWRNGLRYRIHDKSVFGTPDVSNKSKKIVVFVDGCFWHGCPNCYSTPKSNKPYWTDKLARNKNRRKQVKKLLNQDNWKVLEFWECEINNNKTKVAKEIIQNWKGFDHIDKTSHWQ